jgi:hypothetical protein
MSEIHVLVIFTCETGEIEAVALAAAVGAVQGRANIRLRRIMSPSSLDEPPPIENPEAVRMSREYVAPRASDNAWADAFIFAAPDELLDIVREFGSMAGKPAEYLRGMDTEGARLAGRRAAETARLQKRSHST